MSDWVKRMLYGGLEPTVDVEIDPTALEYSMRAISQIDRLCKTNNIKFLVGIYRGAEFFSNTEALMGFEAAVSERLIEAGVDHFVLSNHTDRLSAHSDERSSEAPGAAVQVSQPQLQPHASDEQPS
jgi:hypothetical protein